MSLGIGLLVGFEREWSHKDLGVRTFTIISLFGMFAALIGPAFIVAALAGVIALIVVVNLAASKTQSKLETTTSGAFLVTFALGVLIGQGHVFTPTASAVVITLLLALKPQFSRFAGGLQQEEIRAAVLLGLIGFVIYPILPNHAIDPWNLLNPREIWFTVILIAAIGFLNYVLLRVFSTKGIYYSAIFGGLVNSTAAIAQLMGPIATGGDGAPQLAMTVNLLTITAMFVRNLALLFIFSPPAGLIAAAPIGLMALCAGGFIWWRRGSSIDLPPLDIGSPISLRQIVSFGAIFVAIQVAGSLAQRFFGHYGVILVSALGGFASSASSTAAVATMSKHEQIAPGIAAVSAVLASVASTLVNLPIVYRETRDRPLVRNLILVSLLIAALGVAALGLLDVLNRQRR